METDKITCPKCGEKIEKSSKFCTNCGNEINEEMDVEKIPKRKGRPKKEEQPSIDIESIKKDLKNDILSEIEKEDLKKQKDSKADEINLNEFKSKLKIYRLSNSYCFKKIIK